MNPSIQSLTTSITTLLRELIAIRSYSQEERETGDRIEQFLQQNGVVAQRKGHNVWAKNLHFDPEKPVILLNSHLDTVQPNRGYSRNPFSPDIEDGKLYGLGSNDAGGALCCLLGTFLHFYPQPDLPFSLIFAASAEEEISGINGIELILPELGKVDFGIVGEPTKMQMAIAEKGLMVVDALAIGRSGHAAREEGLNALYMAMDDIAWIRNHRFPEVSEVLGPVKMSVTVIQAGSEHNVVPERCSFTIDVRVNECYTLEQVLAEMQAHVQSELIPRSMRMRSSMIPLDHPLIKAGLELGLEYYGSPTTSDKALMPFPTLKMGPGDSARSHTADEFIYLSEMEEGVGGYIRLLEQLKLTQNPSGFKKQ